MGSVEGKRKQHVPGKEDRIRHYFQVFGPSLERIVGNKREVDRLELDESLESV